MNEHELIQVTQQPTHLSEAGNEQSLPQPQKGPSTGASTETHLPTLYSALSPEEVIAALDVSARKGKLPGFAAEPPRRAFLIADFGKPFESTLIGEMAEATDRPGMKSRIAFSVRMKPTMPTVFMLVLIASVWPGILLTDSMLRMYFSWYTIPTWWWYLPMTVPFVPFAWWKAWKVSRASGHAEAEEIIRGVSELI